jgi:hypothetical protein
VKRAFFAVYFLILAGPVHADVSIVWQSDLNATNRQSDGATPIDGSFVFELGSFVGITPTAGNLDQWQDAWRPFGAARYSTAQKRFSNSKTLTSNVAPFTTTTQAYIWGRNGTAPGSEWILIGKSAWKWPNANPGGPPPFPVNWLVDGAAGGDVILGSVNEGGFHMQTAATNFDLTYEKWVAIHFTGGEASAAGDDFDNDGRSNFLEYALDSDPRVVDGPFQVAINANREIEFARGADRVVNWVINASDDLTGFIALTEGFEIVADEPTRLVYRITSPLGVRQFYQVEATQP